MSSHYLSNFIGNEAPLQALSPFFHLKVQGTLLICRGTLALQQIWKYSYLFFIFLLEGSLHKGCFVLRNIDSFCWGSVFLSCRFKREGWGKGICLVALDLFDQKGGGWQVSLFVADKESIIKNAQRQQLLVRQPTIRTHSLLMDSLSNYGKPDGTRPRCAILCILI